MSLVHDHLKRQTFFWILCLTAGGSAALSLYHFFWDPQPLVISFLIPPLSFGVSTAAAIHLRRHPAHLNPLIQVILWLYSCLFGGTLVFVLISSLWSPTVTLVASLPPITSILYLFTTLLLIFLRPKQALLLALLAWLFTGVPIALYLLWHPDELSTPRGLDLLVSFGPSMGVNLLLMAFYTRIQGALDHLESERFRLTHLAERDGMTGLYNRRTGENLLQAALDSGDPQFAVMLMDIDRFKTINDTYGHEVGDQVIQEAVRRCVAQVRSHDVMMRWGGEEFLVLARGITPLKAYELAERLREAIAGDPMSVVGQVTASFGLAYARPGVTQDILVREADQALYAAKHAGRNRVVIWNSQEEG